MSKKQDLARKRNWCLFVLASINSHIYVLRRFGIDIRGLQSAIKIAYEDLEMQYQLQRNAIARKERRW